MRRLTAVVLLAVLLLPQPLVAWGRVTIRRPGDMMLTVDNATLNRLDKRYPGIRKTILAFEKAALPACARCGSRDTADVGCGVIGRTIDIAAATTKFKLLPNGPAPGRYFCNTCQEFFD